MPILSTGLIHAEELGKSSSAAQVDLSLISEPELVAMYRKVTSPGGFVPPSDDIKVDDIADDLGWLQGLQGLDSDHYRPGSNWNRINLMVRKYVPPDVHHAFVSRQNTLHTTTKEALDLKETAKDAISTIQSALMDTKSQRAISIELRRRFRKQRTQTRKDLRDFLSSASPQQVFAYATQLKHDLEDVLGAEAIRKIETLRGSSQTDITRNAGGSTNTSDVGFNLDLDPLNLRLGIGFSSSTDNASWFDSYRATSTASIQGDTLLPGAGHYRVLVKTPEMAAVAKARDVGSFSSVLTPHEAMQVMETAANLHTLVRHLETIAEPSVLPPTLRAWMHSKIEFIGTAKSASGSGLPLLQIWGSLELRDATTGAAIIEAHARTAGTDLGRHFAARSRLADAAAWKHLRRPVPKVSKRGQPSRRARPR